MTCRYVTLENHCQISSELAQLPILASEDACNACKKLPKPQQVNKVTLSKAMSAVKHDVELYRALLNKLKEIEYPFMVRGPGTELKKLIEWFPVTNKNGCKACRLLEIRMNKWGPEVCLQKMDFILRKLHIAALRRNLPFSRTLVKLLVLKAIRNYDDGNNR